MPKEALASVHPVQTVPSTQPLLTSLSLVSVTVATTISILALPLGQVLLWQACRAS